MATKSAIDGPAGPVVAGDHLRRDSPLDLTTNHGLLRCPSLYCGASLDSFSQAVATSLPTPPPPTSSRPPTPSVRWPKIGAHLQKNDLK